MKMVNFDSNDLKGMKDRELKISNLFKADTFT